MKNLLMAIPFLILFGNGISFIWREFYYESYENWYGLVVQVYALLVIYFMWYYARLRRFCAYSFIAIYGWLALTLCSIAYFYVTYGYERDEHPEIFEKYDPIYHVYGGALVLIFLCMATIFGIRTLAKSRMLK